MLSHEPGTLERDDPAAGRDNVRLDREVELRGSARAVGSDAIVAAIDGAGGVERSDRDRKRRIARRRDPAEDRCARGRPAMVAAGHDDDQAGLHGARDRAAQRVGGGRLADRVTEREVDDAHAVPARVGDRPVDAGDDVARIAGAVAAEHAHVDEMHPRRASARERRRHARGRRRASADDAGDVRAVPERIARDVRLVPHEVDPRDDAPAERRVVGDARVDDGDADAAAREARLREKADEPTRSGPDLVRARDFVGDRHVGDDRQVTRDVRDAAVGDEAVRFRVGEVERKGSGELTPEPPAKAAAERRERALLRLHDYAHAGSARQGRFQVLGNGRASLSLGMSRRQQQADDQRDKDNHPTHGHTPDEDTSPRCRDGAPCPEESARSGPGLRHAVGRRLNLGTSWAKEA